MRQCTHNDGLHVWYLTGKTRAELREAVVEKGDTPAINHRPEKVRVMLHEQLCHNCGDIKWD